MPDEKQTRGPRQRGATTQALDALPGSPHLWATVCAACLVVAATLLLTGNVEASFVFGALGAVAWFIRLRNSLRVINEEGATQQGEKNDEDDAEGEE